jgi:hypothetical protein
VGVTDARTGRATCASSSEGRLQRLARAVSAAGLARPASGIFLFWVAGLALLVFAGAWWVLSFDWHVQHPDLGFYQGVGEAFARGQVPYRDFDPTYPPAALPILILPFLAGAKEGIWEGYALRFEHLTLLLGGLLVVAVVLALGALHANRGRTILATSFVALSPLLVGSILPARFDLWPAALTTGALAAVVAGRTRLGGAILGLAVAAKAYPVVILPLLVAHVWRRSGGWPAIASAGWAVVGAAVPALPFVILAPSGLVRSMEDFLARPLQVESIGAAVLGVAHTVAGVPIEISTAFGSDNLVGPLPDAAAAIQTVLLVATLGGLWLWFARRSAGSAERLVTAAAAAVCAFILFGKVLSGQYLIWLIPLVALIEGRRGLLAGAALVAALLLMQQWYPGRYPDWIAGRDPGVAWIVLARDLILALALAVIVVPREWLGRASALVRIPRPIPSAGLAPENALATSRPARLEGGRPIAVDPSYPAYVALPDAAKEE